MGVAAALQALAWLAVSVRLGVRYMLIKRRLGWDDSELDLFPLLPIHCRRTCFRQQKLTSPAGLIAIAMLPVTVHAALQIASNSSVSRRHVSCF